MPAPEGIPPELVAEGQRVMQICNACRYCEGFCAVFPALERRLSFLEGDLTYLANLCHNCGECYHACQYAPPHPFELNFPQTLARIRGASYRKFARPRALGFLFAHPGAATSAIALASTALLLGAILLSAGPSALVRAYPDARGAFHALIPHGVMVVLFGAVSLWVAVALGLGMVAFWRDTGESAGAALSFAALGQALSDVFRLRYLDGGGDGCAYPDEVPSHARRFFHHLTYYGFLSAFASTSVAAIYHDLLHRPAPYPLLGAPVLLGIAGGAGLLAGPAGLLWLKVRRNPELTDRRQASLDVSFLVLLQLTSLSGLLLLGLRETSAMGLLLAAHLGLVLALFITMPYGKFVHGIYRFGALLLNALERRRPKPQLGGECPPRRRTGDENDVRSAAHRR